MSPLMRREEPEPSTSENVPEKAAPRSSIDLDKRSFGLVHMCVTGRSGHPGDHLLGDLRSGVEGR